MICCNTPRPIPCYEEEKLELGAEVKVNYNQEMRNILQLLQHSDLKNRRLAITLAKGFFKMDAFDLCQYLKKQYLFKKQDKWSGFCQVLEIIELMINGWHLDSASCPSMGWSQDKPPTITMSLSKGISSMAFEFPEEQRGLIVSIIQKNYKLKKCAYRYALLKWDR